MSGIATAVVATAVIGGISAKKGKEAAQQAAGVQAEATKSAAQIESETALKIAELQTSAQRESATIQAGAAKEAAGLLSEAEQQSLNESRQRFGEIQAQLQSPEQLFGGAQQALQGVQQGLQPIQQTELAGLQRQQQALGGQAQLAGGAQQQLGALLGFGGQQAQQEAQAGVLDSPAQQALRNRAARLSTRTASAIGGLGGGNIRSELFERGRELDAQALQQRISQLGGVSQFGAQGLGLGGTALAAAAPGQQASIAGQQGVLGLGQAELATRQAGTLSQQQTDLAKAQALGIIAPAQFIAGGLTGASAAQAQGLAGSGQAQAGGLLGGAQAQASGILGGQQAQAQGLQNIVTGIGTALPFIANRPLAQTPTSPQQIIV